MQDPSESPPEPPGQFERLVEEYADRVYGVALRVTGSTQDAEDAMQDAFLSIFRNLGSFRGDAAIGTWIYRTAVNAALQVRRRRPRTDELLLDDGFEHQHVADWLSSDVETQAERDELAVIVERGIRLLPEDFQLAVILRDVEGLTTREAAEALQIGEALLKTRLHRGRALLRTYLAEHLAVS
jgi:RNA polymerase sigma-70 factor (ECF subfamily)